MSDQTDDEIREHVRQWSHCCDCDDCRKANNQPLPPDYKHPTSA